MTLHLHHIYMPMHCLTQYEILVITTNSPQKNHQLWYQNSSLQVIKFIFYQDVTPPMQLNPKKLQYQILIILVEDVEWYVTLIALTTCIIGACTQTTSPTFPTKISQVLMQQIHTSHKIFHLIHAQQKKSWKPPRANTSHLKHTPKPP